MQIFKRIVGLLLCLAMVLSFVPVSHTHVHAAETVQPGTTTTTTDPVKQGTVLKLVSATRLTPIIGYFPGKTTPEGAISEFSGESECLTDGWYFRVADTNNTKYTSGLIVAMATLDTTTTLGAVEINAHNVSGYDPTKYEVQIQLTDDTWKTVGEETSNPWTATKRTITYTFTPVEAKAVRVLVKEHEGAQCYFAEIAVYESTTGKIANKIDLNGTEITHNQPANIANNPGSLMFDGNKATIYQSYSYNSPIELTFSLTKDGKPTAVDYFMFYPGRGNNYYQETIEIYIQKTSGGSYEKIGTYDTEWGNKTLDVLVGEFDKTYEAYGMKISVTDFTGNPLYYPEFELYQYERAADPNAAPVVGTPGGMQKLDVSKCTILACSQDLPDTGVTNYVTQTWYSRDDNPGWSTDEKLIDKNTSAAATWSLSSNEKADLYLDLTSFSGGYVAADKLVLYSGDRNVTEIKVVLVRQDGENIETTLNPTDWNGTVGKELTYEFGTTYNLKGVYVWESSIKSGYASYAEIELYQNQTVQLPAVTGLNVTEVTSNSITVTANNVTVSGTGAIAGDLQFSIDDGENWETATNGSYTFTGLTAGTEYTILARYYGTNGYITTKEADIVSTEGTTEAGVQQLPAPTGLAATVTETTVTATVTSETPAGGKLVFSLVPNDVTPTESDWQESGEFTGLTSKTGYDLYAKYIPTSSSYTESPSVDIDVKTLPPKLDRPTGFTKTEVTGTSITVTANTNVNGILYFRLCQGEDWGGWVKAEDDGSYTFSNLTYGTEYLIHAIYEPIDKNEYASSDFIGIEVTTFDCEHVYDNACDADCNECGETRTPADHVYDNACDADCNVCGATRVPADHVYVDCEDADCNECGEIRIAPGHKYTDCEDTTCDNDCGEIRTAPGHKYTDECDADCNECDVTREPPHKYENACDAECDCGATRVPADHDYDDKYDAECNVCGAVRDVPMGPTDYPEIPGLTELSGLPTPIIGYYDNYPSLSGAPISYSKTDGDFSDGNVVNGNIGDRAGSLYFAHAEVENKTKIPAIYFDLGTGKTLGAIEVYGYEAYRYNMEDFEVQVYVDGAWKSVAAAVDAFHVDGAEFGDDLTGDNQSVMLYFDKLYTTSQVRILVNGMSDMTPDAEKAEDEQDKELFTGSYIRVREIKLYEGVNTCEHEYDNACDADCNLCGETRVPSDHVYTDCADDTCNVCSEKRTAPGHKFDNCDDTQCNQCTATREPLQHQYENACDVDCNECGAIREVEPHEYTDACDVDCNICFEEREAPHVYDNACDTECNNCGATREGSHVYDNDCDADCNICHYLRPDATGHKYDNECDEDCNNCGFVRTAKHVYDDCDDTECNKCSATREPIAHVYKNACDPDCDVCHKNRGEVNWKSHEYTDACDSTCDKCEGHRNAPHVFSSIYDPDCDVCGATRTVQEEPETPDYPDKEQLVLDAPVFGYYSDRNTNGPITNCYYIDPDTGKEYGPDLLIDGIYTDKANRATSEPYFYADVRQGVKIPVILFEFEEAVDVCSIDIYGYAYNYYNIETFDVQVYTDGEWLNVAHITNAFTDGEFEDQVNEPLTINFNQPYEATQLRILVRSITDMTGKGDITTGDDEFGYAAPFRVKEIEIYQLEMSDDVYLTEAELNGIDIGDYKIIYSDDEPDYNYRAAEYLQKIIKKKTGRDMEIVEASEGKYTYEILVGDTDRDLSVELTPPANRAMKFAIQADNSKIALEADYFIIAAAAYYFGEELVPDETETSKTVSTDKQELEPIVHEPNNYIMLIGDGMGVNQTKLFDVYDVTESQFAGNCDISDNEDIFYGYYFPYEGRSHTWNVMDQITDSAAGGSALSTGYKTINGTVGLDWYGNEVQNLSELALELGLAAGVFSTEGSDGATPASFSVHTNSRHDDEIPALQVIAEQKGILFVDRYYDNGPDVNCELLTESEWNAYEAKVRAGLNKLASDPDGFFLMYEEAHIDKYLHKADATSTFKALYRFNQAIGIFMEYAMYNPDTIVLITADHETGGITLGAPDSGNVTFNTPNPPDEGGMNHSNQDVPVFAYGFGMEVFDTDVENGEYYENASIGRTYAHFMTNGHADDFGDPWYPILVDGTTLVEYPDDPMTIIDGNLHQINGLEAEVDGSVKGNLTDGSKGTYGEIGVGRNDPAIITIDLTNSDGTPTNIKKMNIFATSTSTAPATTIVEVMLVPDGDEDDWLQIYKDTLYGTMYGEPFETNGILDFHTFYNAYQVRITINSVNTTGGFGDLELTEIELYGYNVQMPDVGGVVTSAGDANENAVVKLMKGDSVAYTATVTGNSYYVMNVANGDYTVVATKNGHITAEYDITVKGKPVRQDVDLKYVSTQASVGVSQSVRLIEPWAMRNFIQFGTKDKPIYLTSILGYGAYAVIEHKAGETAPDSWDDIVYNDKAICFEKSYTAGNEKISHTSLNGRNRRYNVLFDFYDMLYTYRMAEQVYWVAFYEDAEGIHFTEVCNISMSELIDEIIEDADPSETEKTVLNDMKTLHKELLEFRGPNANLGNTPYPEGVKLSDSDIVFEDINFGVYQFGKKRQIRLIEPWGFKVTLRFRSNETKTVLSDPHGTAADYGMIFYHDKHRRHVENGMSYDEMLAQSDALVFSKSMHNMTVDKDAVLAVYTKDIYTYQLDSELYCLPFIKMGNQYYFPENAVCWNLLGEMIEIRDDTKDHTQAERDVFTAMVNLYYDVTKHLGYN